MKSLIYLTQEELFNEFKKIESNNEDFFNKNKSTIFDYIFINLNEDNSFNYFFKEKEIDFIKRELDSLLGKTIQMKM
jgi:hypothetical protein